MKLLKIFMGPVMLLLFTACTHVPAVVPSPPAENIITVTLDNTAFVTQTPFCDSSTEGLKNVIVTINVDIVTNSDPNNPTFDNYSTKSYTKQNILVAASQTYWSFNDVKVPGNKIYVITAEVTYDCYNCASQAYSGIQHCTNSRGRLLLRKATGRLPAGTSSNQFLYPVLVKVDKCGC